MGRIGLAFRIFFNVLFNAEKAASVRSLEHVPAASPADATSPVDAAKPAEPTAAKPIAKPTVKPVTQRSDALTLLEALQREARLIDFIQEDISSYSDAQIGSAVRDVHRGCHSTLKRLFDLQPASGVQEGQSVTLKEGDDEGAYRLVGKVSSQRPITGQLVHSGWKAGKCEMPLWSGADSNRLIVAPAELEVS